MPGIIPLLCLSATKYPHLQELLITTAERAAQITWDQGLLLKGNSLCHGIAGNTYFLHSMARKWLSLTDLADTEEDEEAFKVKAAMWRSRSFIFAKAMFDPNVQ